MTSSAIAISSNAPKARLGGGRALWIWSIATIFVLYVFGVQTVFAIVQGSIQSDLNLTLAQVALVGSIYTWTFAVLQFFSGPILDSYGSRWSLIPAVALSVAGVWLYATAQDLFMLQLAQVVMAAGAVFGFVGAGYIGGMWFGMANFGMMFGFVETSSSVASAFEQQLTSMALNHVTWRDLMQWIGGFGVLLWIATLIWVRNPEPVPASDKSVFTKVSHGLVVMMKNPQAWLCGLWGGVTFGINLAVGVIWAPHMLTDKGFSLDIANWGASLVWLGLGIGSLFWPRWSDWEENRKIPALVGIGLQALTLAAIIYLPGAGVVPAWVFLVLWLVNGIVSANEMVAFQMAADLVPSEDVGSSAAFVNGLMFIIGGFLMNVPSSLLGKHDQNVNYAYLPFVGALVIAFILALIQRETFPRESA